MSAPSCLPFFFFGKTLYSNPETSYGFKSSRPNMTEKQGNTKQSNLSYIHTVINIQKKTYKSKVKNKREMENRSNF